MPLDPGLDGRSVLITGASGGIGSEVASVLAEQGACCLLHGRNVAALDALRTRLDAANPFARIGTAVADLRTEPEVDRLFEEFDASPGTPFGLVVNAGIWPEKALPIKEMSLGQWRNTLEVNLTGAFLCCRAFLRLLEDRRAESASIVLVGSTAGIYGEEGHADYAASKSALRGLMLSLKNEIVRSIPNGRVNLVQPGWVATPMAAEALKDPRLVQRATATMALQKVARPRDVATLVAFLLSDRLAGHLTGSSIPVAGGMEGRLLHMPKVEG